MIGGNLESESEDRFKAIESRLDSLEDNIEQTKELLEEEVDKNDHICNHLIALTNQNAKQINEILVILQGLLRA